MKPIKIEDLFAYFLKLPPENIVYLKFLLESYESIGVLRTLNRQTGEVVILALEHEIPTVERLIAELKDEIQLRPLATIPDMSEDWLMSSLGNGMD